MYRSRIDPPLDLRLHRIARQHPYRAGDDRRAATPRPNSPPGALHPQLELHCARAGEPHRATVGLRSAHARDLQLDLPGADAGTPPATGPPTRATPSVTPLIANPLPGRRARRSCSSRCRRRARRSPPSRPPPGSRGQRPLERGQVDRQGAELGLVGAPPARAAHGHRARRGQMSARRRRDRAAGRGPRARRGGDLQQGVDRVQRPGQGGGDQAQRRVERLAQEGVSRVELEGRARAAPLPSRARASWFAPGGRAPRSHPAPSRGRSVLRAPRPR